MEKRHRIFIAINLPEEIKKELIKFQEDFAMHNNSEWARWTSKDNLHITLEFLGDLTDQELGEVCNIIKEVAEQQSVFSLSLSNISYGPNKFKTGQAPKFIWASGEKSEELAVLKSNLQKQLLQKIRFAPEERSFSPHITLARISSFAIRQIDQEEVPEINHPLDLIFTVESIEVMESDLRRGGPVYTILESHQLKC